MSAIFQLKKKLNHFTPQLKMWVLLYPLGIKLSFLPWSSGLYMPYFLRPSPDLCLGTLGFTHFPPAAPQGCKPSPISQTLQFYFPGMLILRVYLDPYPSVFPYRAPGCSFPLEHLLQFHISYLSVYLLKICARHHVGFVYYHVART